MLLDVVQIHRKLEDFLSPGEKIFSNFSLFQLIAHPFFKGGDVRGLKKFNPGPVSVKSFAPFSLDNVTEHFLLFIISGPF